MRRLKFLFLLFVFATCRDKYDFPLRETDVSLLVVEGVLNAGQGPTTISLSRTLKLSDKATIKPITKAKLTVEGKNGGTFPLSETGNGNYTNAQLPLVFGQEYRLRIQTSDNKEYLSDYVIAKQTPAIDSISWKKKNDGVTIYANTHDANNKTRYYKWDYDETWEIRSFYYTEFRWTSGTTIIRSPGYHSVCWKYARSTSINLGSTVQLQSDVVSEAPLIVIPSLSDKLSVRYSIIVRQQSLTKEAYEYLQLMKKNTESIGSIFDAQPSELKGNIKCVTNPEEGVVGYLTASSIPEKRIFITAGEAGWFFPQDCPFVEVPNQPDSIASWVPGYLPFSAAKEMFGSVARYNFAPASCVDCVTRGGDVNRPSYW
ncbi:MAG TPA: DUF4249 domain-containing protein [Flavisolibacter sp.]|jgi:hypothetical protein|nr:DUF4249 domain-containing protein [Flavisolibacter sp.]